MQNKTFLKRTQKSSFIPCSKILIVFQMPDKQHPTYSRTSIIWFKFTFPTHSSLLVVWEDVSYGLNKSGLPFSTWFPHLCCSPYLKRHFSASRIPKFQVFFNISVWVKHQLLLTFLDLSLPLLLHHWKYAQLTPQSLTAHVIFYPTRLFIHILPAALEHTSIMCFPMTRH